MPRRFVLSSLKGAVKTPLPDSLARNTFSRSSSEIKEKWRMEEVWKEGHDVIVDDSKELNDGGTCDTSVRGSSDLLPMEE